MSAPPPEATPEQAAELCGERPRERLRLELRDPREQLSPRVRLMWQVTALIQELVLVIVLVIAALTFWDWGWRWAVIATVLVADLVYLLVVPPWRYRVHRWEVTDTAVYTQTGWWTRERRIAPMSRIQTVDYQEGAISRLFGLASVTVTTASAAGALEIDGLDKDTAQRLVDELTLRADAVSGDAT